MHRTRSKRERWCISARTILPGAHLVFVVAVVSAGWPLSTAGTEPVRLPQNQRQLFFDDALIEKTVALERTLHQPAKYAGNPVLVREHPWEGFRVQVYGTAIYDPATALLKIWYLNIPKTAAEKVVIDGQRRPGHATLLSYATSKDGIEWHKPALNLVSYEGSTENNMVSRGMYNPEGVSILYEPEDSDPSRRYKAFYWDHGYGPLIIHEGLEIHGTGSKDGMYVAFSPDGIHWQPYAKNPVMKYGSDTGQVVLYDKRIARYVAYGRFGAGGRKVARAESVDFIHWSKPELVLAPDQRDGPNTQFYGITINLYEGTYVGVLWMFWIEEDSIGRIDFQLCHSRDGKEWTRDPERRVFLPNGPAGAWDSGDMRAACRAVVLPDRILYYYAGSRARHGLGGPKRIGMDIGLATLRRDGWVSLDAGAKPGTLVTRPFVHPGGELHLNANAEDGRIVGQFLNEQGEPIAGWGPSATLAADTLAGRVSFDGRRADALAGRTVQLKLNLTRAQLYAFWFAAVEE